MKKTLALAALLSTGMLAQAAYVWKGGGGGQFFPMGRCEQLDFDGRNHMEHSR